MRPGYVFRSTVSTALLCGVAAGLAAQQRPTLRSGTTLVQVTIVARDRKGMFVGGLTADDFTITEDGKPVVPTFFREVSGPVAATAATSGRPPNVFTNATGGTPASVTVILLDRLNTRWIDQARTREQLKVFFSQLRSDDRVAVYALDGNALRVLHDFTSDASALLRAVDPSARLTAAHIDAASDPATSPVVVELMTAVAANTTVVALQTIGQHLAAIPGRKNVVWVSSGFSIGNSTLGVSQTDAMQRVVGALNTANISVYSIDPKGVPDVFGSVTATTTTFASGITPNHDILLGLAEETGGRAFLNNNDIAGSVRAALDDAARYYELDYESPVPSTDPRYREIRITSRKPGVDLHYRRGYYATAAQAPGGDRKTTIERAIGNPLAATGIPLEIVPRNTAADGGVELSVHADGAGLLLTADNGTWSGALDLSIAQVRPDGTATVDIDTTVALHLSDAQHAAIVQDGVTLTKTITVGPDTTRVAVVVRDAGSGAIGSVVIPAAKLRPAR